ncbi:hypothetical protein [Arthrobacter woluwensis]|jgi:hypothetical protein|uniref:hypothetical protein n=1 Tax=Arthrobacter woluwensis TaxID=156980 RepID=UPI001AAE76DA|nr:hypothetical protein [Arthrobacter woluwensis]QTF73417.1 hypothetical protein G8758_16440 [Arthrobacter woluwensis]
MRIELSRLDAHAADSVGRERTVEHPADDLLSGLLETAVRPWLASAPLANWICRAEVRGERVDIAEFPWARGRDSGFQLLIADEPVDRLLTPGATAFEIVGLPSFG